MLTSIEKPKVIFYNISETLINCTNPGTISKISFEIFRTNYIGLQRVEFDEESRFTYIDEDIHYLPLNTNFSNQFNKMYLHKNEMYTEICNGIIEYTKIVNKKISAILINPYQDKYHNKTLIEFNESKGEFPYNFSSIQFQELDLYHSKVMMIKNNEVIYDENLYLAFQSYEIQLNIVIKKTDKLYIRLINLSNMANLWLGNICIG